MEATVHFRLPRREDGISKVFEVSEELLSEIKENRVVLKAHKDQDAVLVTGDHTYLLGQVESSNTCYFCRVEEESGGAKKLMIEGEVKSSISTALTKPDLERLAELMAEEIYPPSEAKGETESEMRGVAWETIDSEVPASEREIHEAMLAMDVCQINGRYWKLSDAFKFELYDAVFNAIIARQETLQRCSKDGVIAALAESYAEGVVAHVFNAYGSRLDEEEGMWRLHPDQLLRLVGTALLASMAANAEGIGSRFYEDEFLESWKSVMGEGFEVNPGIEHLKGYVLREEGPAGPVLQYLPRSSLPPQPAARLKSLFRIRPRWMLPDLEPFIEDLVGPGRSQADLLLSHTRSTLLPDGQREYSAR